MPDYSFTLNNQDVLVTIEDPKTSSLEVLREVLGIHTCKAGCSPQGLCGCCTALIDGKARLTCTLPVKSLAGKAVTTMDGLPADDRALLADSFVRSGGAQCGYCTPGIVLNAWSLLAGTASPTRDEINRALGQHLCRCTGYTAIAAAIERAAAVKRGDPDPLAARVRPEGADVATGDRPYVDDLERPGMLYGGVVFAPVAVGTLDTVDVDAARALPGVRAVIVRKAAGGELAHAGEVVVAVAAESPAAVRAAQAACVVKATARPANVVLAEAPEVARGRRADGEAGALAASAHQAAGAFRVAATDPVYLEPEAALAVPVTGGLHVYSAGHDAHAESKALTDALGVPVRVMLVPSGGSYGGKEALVVSHVAGELARETGLPVRVSVGMEAGMRIHPRRPAGVIEAEVGCDAAGRLTAIRVEATLDGGAACIGADRLVAQALGAIAYEAPNVEISVRVVKTDNPSAGPVRGGGAVGVVFAVEQLLSELARARGEDGLALRRRNLSGDAAAVLDHLLPGGELGARGLAIAAADGAGGARVTLTVTGPDEVEVTCNVPELGQGRDEALAAALVQTTGLPAGTFSIAWADSALVGAGAPLTAPVESAARSAGYALAAAGGSLGDLVGRRFTGEAPDRAPTGYTAALATLGEAGELTGVRLAAACGADQAPLMVTNLLEGAAHMGVGLALSEEVETKEGLPEGRLRFLGVLKPKVTPPFDAHAVVRPGGARDVAEAAVMAVPAAVAGAVAALEGKVRHALPMKDSAAAKAAGVRPPKA